MGKLFFCEVCILPWALMLMHSAAEPLFFHINNILTWDDARNHCQLCFKDLVTVKPNNTNIISQNLTSDYWIGLRKNVSPSNYTSNYTSNSSMTWSRWANGDPLAFQNWYPGWPVFKSPLPKINCCSCSCTCPLATTPSVTSFSRYTTPDVSSFSEASQNVTNFANVTDQNTAGVPGPTISRPSVSIPTVSTAPSLPVEAACVKSPTPLPDLPDPNVNYIEDSCVAMLTIGAWVEKNCTDLLPFICYEDRFFGNVKVDNVTASDALLTWLPGPSGISHYRLEVTDFQGNRLLLINLSLSLNYSLGSLTAGYNYTVTVFAVKCDRDIDNPQKTSFYTIPNKVVNLTVTVQTNISITLNWDQPAGNVDFYRVQFNATEIKTNSTHITVDSLTPGSLYTFIVCSGVNDTSKWSDQSIVAAYTKPGSVSNLTVFNNTNISLMLSWSPPQGQVTGYRVMTMNGSQFVFNNTVVNQSPYTVQPLPPGTKITLSVTAQANYSLEGDTVTVDGFTAPGPVSNLNLSTTDSTLTANWTRSADNFSTFTVTLHLDTGSPDNTINTPNESIVFYGLKTAANYTVIVCSVSGGLKSPPVSSSIFTLPSPPINATVLSKNSSQITFQWTPPINIATGNYSVKLTSSFWGQMWSAFENTTSHTFSDLKSGTRYQFEVRTLAGGFKSDPVTITQSTDSRPVQISLSMLCSSAQPLLCANSNTMDNIFQQLNNTMVGILGDNVFWALSKQTSENLAP